MCWWLWITLLDRVPAWEASLSLLGTPVVAIVSACLTLGEDFTFGEVMGISLIGTELALLSLIGRAASPPQQDEVRSQKLSIAKVSRGILAYKKLFEEIPDPN